MGGKGGKRKGGAPMVLRFGAGGIRTTFLTPSALGSMTGVEVATGMSYDVPVKVPRVNMAASVAEVAALSGRVEMFRMEERDMEVLVRQP